MEWAEITVTTTSMGAEAVSEMFMRAGCPGTAIEDPAEFSSDKVRCQWDYYDEELDAKFLGDVLVKGYLPQDERLLDSIAYIRQELSELEGRTGGFDQYDLGECAVSVKTINEDDWANAWKKHYKPTRVSEHFVIVPSWEEYARQPGELIISMDPGMAFGTGTHETTRMCLELADAYVKPGDVCIDIGCGTAILAIGAALKGAVDVLAIDRDAVAVRVAKLNVERNGAKAVRVVEGDLLTGAQAIAADVVLVNIIADVIIGLVPKLAPFVKPGGRVIFSGIIKERAQQVIDAVLDCGYAITDSLEQGEWCALGCVRGQ